MPRPNPYPPITQLKVSATRLAMLANIPKEDRKEFCDRIVRTVLALRELDRRSTGARPGGRLIEAAEAARILDKKFSDMNLRDREWVEGLKKTQGVVFAAGEIDHLETTITNIAMLLHDAIGKPYRGPKHPNINRHTVEDQRLRDLVFGLLSAASDSGCRFTFNKNSVSGTLAEALDRLRVHLPKGLVPNTLPGSTIQRLKTEFERLRRR
jgi:hypothetical protein